MASVHRSKGQAGRRDPCIDPDGSSYLTNSTASSDSHETLLTICFAFRHVLSSADPFSFKVVDRKDRKDRKSVSIFDTSSQRIFIPGVHMLLYYTVEWHSVGSLARQVWMPGIGVIIFCAAGRSDERAGTKAEMICTAKWILSLRLTHVAV